MLNSIKNVGVWRGAQLSGLSVPHAHPAEREVGRLVGSLFSDVRSRGWVEAFMDGVVEGGRIEMTKFE